MDARQILKDCITEFCSDFPEFASRVTSEYPVDDIDLQKEMDYLKPTLQTHFLQIVQKDTELFREPRYFLRGVDFSELMKIPHKEEKVWNYSRMLLMVSYLGCDVLDTIKTLWSKITGNTQTDEIDEILKEESTQSGIENLLETLKETRLFKLGMEVVENLNIKGLGLEDVDFTDIESLMKIVQDPENPVRKRAIQSIQNIIEEKMRRGSLRREDFVAEIEMLKEKFKNSLGRIFKNQVFGDTETRETLPAQTLMSNHPDARRARMLARLQRKLGK